MQCVVKLIFNNGVISARLDEQNEASNLLAGMNPRLSTNNGGQAEMSMHGCSIKTFGHDKVIKNYFYNAAVTFCFV